MQNDMIFTTILLGCIAAGPWHDTLQGQVPFELIPEQDQGQIKRQIKMIQY
jgi:hypothetical protein